MKLKNTVREFAVITFAMLIVSAAVYFFMVPSKIVMGSISGLALVFSQLTGISMSILTFFLNAILGRRQFTLRSCFQSFSGSLND